jgi:hypothetical protein
MRKSIHQILEEQVDNGNKIVALEKMRDDAEKAINNLLYETNTMSPRDTTVNNSRMDDHLRGGGSMGAL